MGSLNARAETERFFLGCFLPIARPNSGSALGARISSPPHAVLQAAVHALPSTGPGQVPVLGSPPILGIVERKYAGILALR